jgi:ketosteroid isomerase-like protein
MSELAIDLPEARAELRAAFEAYERALLAHDVQALDRFFLELPTTVRYGVADHQTGSAAIARWRRSSPPVDPHRTLEGTVVTTFGTAFGVASTLFRRPDEPGRIGRQTQVWVRTGEGWRIAAAHVSSIPEPAGDEAP